MGLMHKTQTQIIPHDQVPDLPSYERFREKSALYVGWDVGKMNDPSAFVVLEHKHVATTTWNIYERFGKPSRKVQQSREEFHVRWIKTLPLGTLHPAQIEFAAELLSKPELEKAQLVIDASGKGDPVLDYAKQAGLNAVGVVLTGGRESTPKFDGSWNVSKQALFLCLDAHMQNGTFLVAPDCPEAKEFMDELKMIRRHQGAVSMQFEAAPGFHDDRVCAAAYPLFLATRPPITPMAQFGSWGQV